MAPPARVAIAFSTAEPDQGAAASLAEGFAREGIAVERASTVPAALALVEGPRAADLVVSSLRLDGDPAEGLVKAVRARLGVARPPDLSRPPIIVVGDAEDREAVLAAGANAFIPRPAFVKDIVTLARIFAMPREGIEPGWGGDLGALHLYYMVRALGAARRSGVLTLLRGGRRGELRFFEGEVTSAQVGALHGQAALHQLLLWPEAHYDLRVENVVRRNQIPLSPVELLQDAEKFMRDFNEMASGISPASIYAQDHKLTPAEIEKIPREAMPVLRLFDGGRSIADVVEDSPMRMPETLRVARNLIALGAVRKQGTPRPQLDAGAALVVEDWLVGQTPPAGASPPPPATAAAATAAREYVQAGEWANLAPASGPPTYAPVVPSQSQTGEIQTVEPPKDETPAARAAAEEEAEPGAKRGNGRRNRKRTVKGAAPVPAPPPPTEANAPDTVKQRREGRSTSGVLDVPNIEVAAGSAPPLAAVEISADLPSMVMPTPAAPPPLPPGRRVSAPRAAVAPPPTPPAALAKFEAHEEDFFRQEEHFAKAETPAADSFSDLDEGTPKPLGFWGRLRRMFSP